MKGSALDSLLVKLDTCTADTVSIISHASDWTSVIQNITLAVCAVLTVWIAYLGLSAWRRELKGKSEYELAKEVLKAVYRVGRAFDHVRNPMIFQYEYPQEMQDDLGHLRGQYDYAGTAHVYEQRWKVLAGAFQELEEKNLDAQVEWGPPFREVIRPLEKCLKELRSAIFFLLEGKKERQNGGSPSFDEVMKKQHPILYSFADSSTDDSFDLKIEAAIERFENALRPYIKN